MNWTQYSTAYDLMADNNPEYQQILDRCQRHLSGCDPAGTTRVLDIGAGTGNFSLLAARTLPLASVVHLEPDPGMNSRLSAKRAALGLENLSLREQPVQDAEFPVASMDLIVCVHALYTMPDPRAQLCRLTSWLRPGGHAFLCDLGRALDVNDWRRFLFRHLLREKGPLRAISLVLRGRQVARQNHNIARLQRAGKYWLHTPAEFRAAVEQSGLLIEEQDVMYRGCSDLVLARKP